MNEELKVIISAEIDELKANVENAKKEVKSFKDRVKDASKEVDDKFKAAGDAIGNGIKTGVTAATAALAAVAVALVGTAAATEEYRNNQAKLSAAFQTVGASAETAKEVYNDLYRVLGDDGAATDAAQQLAQITTEQDKLAEYTNICQGVFAQWGASIDQAGFTEAINHSIELGSVQGTLADALEWVGVSTDDFNKKLEKCSNEAEREKLIRETLNGIYSEAATNYEKAGADALAQNEAQAKLTETLAALGEVMQPIITTFTEFGADVLAQVVPYIQQLGEEYGPQLKDVLNEAADAVKAAFGFFVDNWEIFAAIAGVLAGIATAIGLYNAVAAIKAAMDAAQVTTIWGLVAAHTAQAVAAMAALAPYLLIVAAIAAVIAIIVLCIKYWDEIKEACKKAFEAIVDAIQIAIDWIVGIFEKIIGWVSENWQGLLLLLVNPFAGAFKLIYDNCEGFKKAVDDAVKAIKTFFVNLWKDIKNIFAGVGSWFKNIFNSAVTGIKNVFSSIKGFFSGVWNDIKTIFTKAGTAVADAISGAVKGAINKVLSFAAGIINKFISSINAAISIINAIPGVNIKKLSKLEVPQLAMGGVLKKGQVGLLEGSGAEAVVPLEKNTGWLDKIAERLNANTGAGGPIILQVDGKTFAEISIDSINKLTRQQGSLALNLR